MLATQHRKLVAQHQDFNLVDHGRSAAEHDQLEDPAHRQIDERPDHGHLAAEGEQATPHPSPAPSPNPLVAGTINFWHPRRGSAIVAVQKGTAAAKYPTGLRAGSAAVGRGTWGRRCVGRARAPRQRGLSRRATPAGAASSPRTWRPDRAGAAGVRAPACRGTRAPSRRPTSPAHGT
jgi:hypothetical protein